VPSHPTQTVQFHLTPCTVKTSSRNQKQIDHHACLPIDPNGLDRACGVGGTGGGVGEQGFGTISKRGW